MMTELAPDIDESDLEVGKRIRYARVMANMSREGVAARIGVGKSSVTSWEAGRRAVSIKMLLRLAELFRFDPWELLPPGPNRPIHLGPDTMLRAVTILRDQLAAEIGDVTPDD